MILYFSATGNSKYVAQKIANETNDSIVSLRELIRNANTQINIEDNENFGIVMPCYWGSVPTIFSSYLENTKIILNGDNHFIYFVATYGADYGKVGSRLQSMLDKNNIKLDSTFSVRMVDNWAPYFNLKDKALIRKNEEYAEYELKEVLKSILSRKKGVFIKETRNEEEQIQADKTYEELRQTKLFTVNKERCINCANCKRQCPVEAIEMKDSYPVWVKEKCTLCLGCYHRCPVHAIDFNNQTQNHDQYVNKKVTLDE